MIRASLIAAAIVVSLSLAGCSSDGGNDTATVQEIEAIIDGDINVSADPAGTSATLEIDTTIPVACSVIYGPDTSFGSIAVDNDMQGGAHQDHGPLLTGLSPNTEYSYILQGSDAAGTIYRSDIMTFRTPPATESTLGTNLALTGTVTAASSAFSDQFAAEMAIDGDLATAWSTAGDGNDAWIEIDLGEPQQIKAIAFRTRQMTDGTAITDTFTVTIDDGRTLGPYPAGVNATDLGEPVTTQTVRIDADQTTGGNTGATEIEIYGP